MSKRWLSIRWLFVPIIWAVLSTQIHADVTLRKVRHISAGLLSDITTKVTWFLKDSRFCEKEQTEMLLVSSSTATIYDLKKAKVWKVDFDDETYEEFELSDYKSDASYKLESLLNLTMDKLKSMELEYLYFHVSPLSKERVIGGYKCKGLMLTLTGRFSDPFGDEDIDMLGSFVVWLAKVKGDDPLAKIYDFYFSKVSRDTATLVFEIGEEFLESFADVESMQKQVSQVLTTLFGDTTNLYPVGFEFMVRSGDPTSATSSVLPIFISEYLVGVSQPKIQDAIFKVPEGFEKEEESDWDLFQFQEDDSD